MLKINYSFGDEIILTIVLLFYCNTITRYVKSQGELLRY